MIDLKLIKRLSEQLERISTPRPLKVIIDETAGYGVIKGWSVGESVVEILENIDDFLKSFLVLNNKMVLYFEIEKYDSHSMKNFCKIIKTLNEYYKCSKDITIMWGVDSLLSPLKKESEELKKLCDFPFTIIKA